MSSKISQSDATSKKNKKSKKKKSSSQEEPSEESKKAPGSPTSIGSGSKSIVKKLNLGKIYKKKKEQPPTPDKEEQPKDTSAKTSLEEVVVQDEVETASSTTASRDTEDDRSVSPSVVTPTKEQQPLVEIVPRDTVSDPLRTEPVTPEQETPREEIVTSSRETVEENKEEAQSKEEISEKQEEKEIQEPQQEDKDQLQFQEKLKQLDKTMQQVGQSGGDVKRECLYKILVIGELGAGKTSIIKRYVHQFFSQHYRATIGVDFALKVINWDSNTIIRLQLWDIAGQERFGNMTRVYYKEAVGAFIVFDVTRQATFDAVLKWKNDLDSKVQLPDGGHIPCVLLANKCDQQKEGIVNSANKMEEYCKEHHFSAWYETSAKENINIEEAAKTLVSQILSNDLSDNGKGYGSGKDNGKFPLDSNPDSTSDRRGCSC